MNDDRIKYMCDKCVCVGRGVAKKEAVSGNCGRFMAEFAYVFE